MYLPCHHHHLAAAPAHPSPVTNSEHLMNFSYIPRLSWHMFRTSFCNISSNVKSTCKIKLQDGTCEETHVGTAMKLQNCRSGCWPLYYWCLCFQNDVEDFQPTKHSCHSQLLQTYCQMHSPIQNSQISCQNKSITFCTCAVNLVMALFMFRLLICIQATSKPQSTSMAKALPKSYLKPA